MSRSGYNDDCGGWDLIRWRGAVAQAIRGGRGQKLLRDMAAALDAMPIKRLVSNSLEKDGEVCALGSVGKVRGIDMSVIDPEDREAVGKAFEIAPALAAEIADQNDSLHWPKQTPEDRWSSMRKWVAEHLKEAK